MDFHQYFSIHFLRWFPLGNSFFPYLLLSHGLCSVCNAREALVMIFHQWFDRYLMVTPLIEVEQVRKDALNRNTHEKWIRNHYIHAKLGQTTRFFHH